MVCPVGFNASDPTSFPTPLAVQWPHTLPLRYAARIPEAVLDFVHVPKTGGSSLERCLQVWCARNELRCFHTFHHARTPGLWLGKSTTVRNALDQLHKLPQGKRDAIRVVYGHQESGIDALFTRPVQRIAVLRQPEKRWRSELAFLTRNTAMGTVPPECLPRDEMATYLCHGSDYRKGEIVPPGEVRNEAFYAQRRAPDVETLRACLRRYVLLSTETDSHFAAVGRLLAAALSTRHCRVHVQRAQERESTARAEDASVCQPEQRIHRRTCADERARPRTLATRSRK